MVFSTFRAPLSMLSFAACEHLFSGFHRRWNGMVCGCLNPYSPWVDDDDIAICAKATSSIFFFGHHLILIKNQAPHFLFSAWQCYAWGSLEKASHTNEWGFFFHWLPRKEVCDRYKQTVKKWGEFLLSLPVESEQSRFTKKRNSLEWMNEMQKMRKRKTDCLAGKQHIILIRWCSPMAHDKSW